MNILPSWAVIRITQTPVREGSLLTPLAWQAPVTASWKARCSGHPAASGWCGDHLRSPGLVIGHAARRIRILGVTLRPTGNGPPSRRNLIMDLGGQAERMKLMIRDRGPDFTAAFDAVLADAGTRTVLCNVRAPRRNAIAERWIGDAGASS
jgi:hypothetical protein